MNKSTLVVVSALTLGLCAAQAQAGEIGHFAPGVLNIRDFAMPEPGSYFALYNYFYTTERLNDSGGNEINSITIQPDPGPGATLGLNVNVDAYAIAPTFIWVSDWNILGAKYGAFISLTFGNTSVGASLATQTGSGRGVDESQFGVGDLFVQPFWLGWAKKHFDFALGYGFYAPIGEYDTETVNIPGLGPVKAEAVDNIGLGFWTHQIQGGASWYPWEDRRMAVVGALTYEIHDEKEDFDLTPGDNLTLNWGISQYLPLKDDQSRLLEIGPAGYSSWQVTDDEGRFASSVHDEVHAIGAQVGVTFVPQNATLNLRYLYEFAADDRFQGESIGLNFAIKM